MIYFILYIKMCQNKLLKVIMSLQNFNRIFDCYMILIRFFYLFYNLEKETNIRFQLVLKAH